MNRPEEYFCQKCMAFHPLHYSLYSSGEKHLIVECPKSWYYIKFVPNLNIPTRPSRRLVKMESASKQSDLFGH